MGIFLVYYIISSAMVFLLVGVTLNKHIDIKICALCVLINALFACVLFNLIVSQATKLIFKIVIFFVSSIVLLKPQKLPQYLIILLTLVLYCLLGWGVGILFQSVYFRVLIISVKRIKQFIMLKSIFFLVGGIVLIRAINVFYRKKFVYEFSYDVKLEFDSFKLQLKLFMDSGNCLFDHITGLPVIILSKKKLEKSCGVWFNFDKCRKIRYSTIGDAGELPIFKADNIRLIKNGEESLVSAMVGVVDRDFDFCDGLLQSQVLLEGEYEIIKKTY